MSDTPVVDAEVVPEEEPMELEVEQGGKVLAVRPPASREALMPMDVEQVISGMAAYQAMLPRLLDATDYQDAGRGKQFVKKSGWRKIARAFNLSTEIVRAHVERDAEGNPLRAEVIVRAIAPNGQYGEGDGYCAVGERRFSDAGNRAKIENDLRATATTRAKNRAISDLVGMGEISAEEAEQAPSSAGPVDADEDLKGKCRNALLFLLDGEVEVAEAAWKAIKERNNNVLAVSAAEAVVIVAKAAKDQGENSTNGGTDA